MKLYAFPGACSLSPHIVLRELGLPFELVKVNVKTRTLPDGTDYRKVHPLTYVPLLELDDGTRITEGPAIVQYLADRVPEKRLAPPQGSLERVQLQTWLNFVSTEIHKGFTPMFNTALPEDMKELLRGKVRPVLQWLESELAKRKAFLMGRQFTVADAYLFTVSMPYRAKRAGFDMSPYPALAAYRERVAARASVQAAVAAEGISITHGVMQ
jgi:glutathione S-transferase